MTKNKTYTVDDLCTSAGDNVSANNANKSSTV